METYQNGKLAKSLAGHDKNKIYVIIDSDDEYVFLCDGKNKTLKSPKKKRKKHIQRMMETDLCAAFAGSKPIGDEDVARVIREFL